MYFSMHPKLIKAVGILRIRMDRKYTNDRRLQYQKGLDEKLAWLTQKTEEPKWKKGNFTFHPRAQ